MKVNLNTHPTFGLLVRRTKTNDGEGLIFCKGYTPLNIAYTAQFNFVNGTGRTLMGANKQEAEKFIDDITFDFLN